jgi:uncharacterized repeat protein (TIGR01451 family)
MTPMNPRPKKPSSLLGAVRKAASSRVWSVLGAAALLFSLGFVTAFAGTPAGYAEYIIPFDEDIFVFVTDPVAAGVIGANNTTFVLISVTAWSDTVTVYYDHWENGYGYDPEHPDASADEKYTLDQSDTLNFNSLAVPRPRTGGDGNTYIGDAGNCWAQPTPATALIRNTPNYCYDGRDRIITIGGATTVTRGGYVNAPGPGKLAAIGEEVFPLAPQLIKYVLPFGEGLGPTEYQRVMALVQATEDNTVIQLDFDGNGTFDSFNTEDGYRTARVDPVDGTTKVLNRGDTYVVDRDSDGIGGTLNRGTTILASKTVQVMYFYGETGSNYNTRAVAAFPNGFWGKSYYLSAGGATGGINTNALIYNPNTSAITINWESAVGSGSFSLGANTAGLFQTLSGGYIPLGSGLYLNSNSTFWGTSDIDSNGSALDWGYSMVPDYLASDDQTVAWAPGNSPTLACNATDGRGNGLYLTAILDNTTIFIDANGDGTPDTNASLEVIRGTTAVAPTGMGYRANRLDSLYITGSNTGTLASSPCDLTGARVYATGPFVMSYGENPDRASAAGGLDLGYTVLPSPGNWMDLALTVDKATNPVLVSTTPSATTVTYTLVVKSYEFDINTLSVIDTLAPDWEYIAGTTVITYPDLSTLSGAGAEPTGTSTLTWPVGLFPGGMLPNQQITITFNARTTAGSTFVASDITQNRVTALGTRTVDGVTQTFRATDFVFNVFSDSTVSMTLTKASSIPTPTPVSPGDPITYTMVVGNPGTSTANLTNVALSDQIPPGTTYVPGSGTATCEIPSAAVRDEFTTASVYTGTNGTVSWATDWVETDAYGTGLSSGAAGGFVAVTGGVLQFRYLLSNVRDEITTSNSFAGSNGSNAWATDWFEQIDGGNPNGGAIQLDNNRIEFQDTVAGGTDATAEAIVRSATVTGATSITISTAWTDNGVDAGEGVILQRSLTGGAGTWTTVRTFDGNTTGTGTYNNTFAWTPTDNTIFIRYRALGNYEAGEAAFIDNVDITFNAPVNAVGTQVVRTVNLTGVTSPSLTFNATAANLEGSDDLIIEAATSPAGPFTELARYDGGTPTVAQPYDLTPYISATTAIRFRVSSNYDVNNETFSIDNVNISWTGPTTFATGNPPEFVSASRACTIQPGQSMTVSFGVTADNPFPVSQTEIVNTATASATEIPVPLQATVRNIVLVPSGITGTVGDRVWLDLDADGVFDAGETGLSGVQVTLKDQFGTPLGVTVTDSQGLYTFLDVAPGTGYYVEITGGMPGETVTTFADSLDTNGVFTGNNGTQNWATNWDENNDDDVATTGDIQIANNRIEFRDTTDGGTAVTGESIQRTATVTDATSLQLSYVWSPSFIATTYADSFGTNGVYTGSTGTNAWATDWVETGDNGSAVDGEFRVANNQLEIGGAGLTPDANDEIRRTAAATGATSFVLSYDWSQTGVDAIDDILVQYSTNGTAWTTLRNLDGSVADGTFNDYIPWNPADGTVHVRFFLQDTIEAGEQARFDNVVLQSNGTDQDDIIVEYSTDGSTWTTARTLGNLSPGGTYTDTIPWTPTDTTAFVRFRAEDALETGEQARIDTVVLEKIVGESLIQTTDTVRDDFNIDGAFTGNTGTLDWASAWAETGDDANGATGDIKIANNRIEFGGTGLTVEANDEIRRSVTVTGADSIEVQYNWASTGLTADGSDEVIVEYSTDGVGWTILRTINAAADQTFTDTLAWVPTNNTLFLRYRALDALEVNELATIDAVQVRFPLDRRTAAFDLAAGESYVQADLGFRAAPGTAIIGDLVWVDANNDQTRNPGEPGLGGITVQLYADTNADGVPDGSPIATAVTDSSGAYVFTGIAANGANDYVVTMDTGQSGLTGYTATTATLFYYANLPSGATRVDADFGFRNPSSTFTITDGVWLDNGAGGGTANDGIKNGTEAGIAGVTVSLLNGSGSIIASSATAADGTFSFSGVPGGVNYRWRITDDLGILNDYFGTTASALSGEFQMPGNLTADLTYITPSDNRHFGYNQTRSIGDTVFNDSGIGGGTASDGIQNGTEPGLAGVTVQLFRDVDGDGNYEPGGDDGAAYATQVTDINGKYLFAALPDGNMWFVNIDNTQTALSGYSLTTADFDGGAAGHQRQVTPALTGTNNRLDIDYGYAAAVPFSISGLVFNDENRSGSNNGEAGFEAVTIELLNSGGTVIATTSTASDGSYSFTNLPAGTYMVRVTDTNAVVAGAETTYEKTEGGTPAFPNPIPAYNGQETVVLGPTVTDVDFGYYRPAVTRAVISSFVAQEVRGAVVLEWTTASENGTVGFHLKRWDAKRSRYERVQDRIFPSLVSSPQGGVYRYVDAEAAVGETLQYMIVEVETSGRRISHGPYSVDTRWTTTDLQAAAVADDEEVSRKGESRRPHRERAQTRKLRAEGRKADRHSARKGGRHAAAAKIGVTEKGIYFVSVDELASNGGMTLPRVWPNTYRLSSRGQNIAFLPADDLGGFMFYGEGPTSNVEPDSIYRFSNAANRDQIRSRKNATAPRPTGAEVFTRTTHVEQDLIGAANIFQDPQANFWLWDYVFSGFGSKSFAFRADGAAAGPASITVRLKGGTETPGKPDHHATFTLNGTPIGEVFFDGIEEVATVLQFDTDLLVDGGNVLEVDGLTDTGAPYSLFYLDSFDVSFKSRYRAHENRGEFSAAGNASVLISGFTRSDISVFDITDPKTPVLIDARVSRGSDGSYGAEVASANRSSVYYAATPDAMRRPSRVLFDAPSSLKARKNSAQYLVITTDELKATAQSLADYRSDLTSQVVDIEDIYDEFNFGNASPYALRDFLSHARSKWRKAPRYVVLAGDGTYDYRNVQGFDDNLIPPMLVNTPSGLAPTDSDFTPAEASGRSEMAIGRLPVTTSGEFAEVIRKIVARESALGEDWMGNTLLIADDPDVGGDFVASSEAVFAALPTGSPVVRGYFSVDGFGGTRAKLVDGLNAGTGFVSYVGHGGYDQLADESLLMSSDAPLFTNLLRPSVMTAMTCLSGNTSLPGYSTIGETLVRQEGGGIVALWAPTGMSQDELAAPLAAEFYKAVFDEGTERLGDAVESSRKAYRQSGRPDFMLSIYNLLGDPAMRIR